MKVIYLILSHSLAIAFGISIYHKFFVNYAKEKLDDILYDEICKLIDEERKN